ncbi:hypothetical protein C7C46_11010 [Streptomyces tateyamensis]|uniref:DUF4439 domain-containing protein n=1 Tax=Streptomyces tateyamensis TaxID=565073 RepID=A0A2V4NBU1_9ACTN|nr:DUF4439 domain-containing protein [Streptomyces tateyamensis]PYC81955.1 hypothetical protein C7C46_11010 [Streptomyces tateyamensis]
MQSTGRRTFLATGALAAAGLLAACTSGSNGSGGSGGKGRADTDKPLRTRAVAATDALLAQYAALPAGGAAVAGPLQAELVQQRAALAAGLPAAGSPGAGSPAAAGSGSPGDGGPAVTAAVLAAAERTTAQGRLADLAAASPELARLLASVAAAGALHAVRLGDRTPLTVPADGSSGAAPADGASADPSSTGAASANPPSAAVPTAKSLPSRSQPAKGPAAPPSAAPLGSAAATALQAALAAEHAAVYAFGVVGAKTPPGPRRDDALACYAVHQARRDNWQRLLAGGATPTAAAPGYRLPFAVPEAGAAAKLAAEVESRLLAVYADLVACTTDTLRMTAATALRECVLQCDHWGGTPGALPGLAAPDTAGSASPSTAVSPH